MSFAMCPSQRWKRTPRPTNLPTVPSGFSWSLRNASAWPRARSWRGSVDLARRERPRTAGSALPPRAPFLRLGRWRARPSLLQRVRVAARTAPRRLPWLTGASCGLSALRRERHTRAGATGASPKRSHGCRSTWQGNGERRCRRLEEPGRESRLRGWLARRRGERRRRGSRRQGKRRGLLRRGGSRLRVRRRGFRRLGSERPRGLLFSGSLLRGQQPTVGETFALSRASAT